MLVVYLSVVSHNLQSSEHRAKCEKAKSLCAYYTKSDHLLSVHVSDAVEHSFGCGCNGRHARHDSSRIAEGVEDGLEVC